MTLNPTFLKQREGERAGVEPSAARAALLTGASSSLHPLVGTVCVPARRKPGRGSSSQTPAHPTPRVWLLLTPTPLGGLLPGAKVEVPSGRCVPGPPALTLPSDQALTSGPHKRKPSGTGSYTLGTLSLLKRSREATAPGNSVRQETAAGRSAVCGDRHRRAASLHTQRSVHRSGPPCLVGVGLRCRVAPARRGLGLAKRAASVWGVAPSSSGTGSHERPPHAAATCAGLDEGPRRGPDWRSEVNVQRRAGQGVACRAPVPCNGVARVRLSSALGTRPVAGVSASRAPCIYTHLPGVNSSSDPFPFTFPGRLELFFSSLQLQSPSDCDALSPPHSGFCRLCASGPFLRRTACGCYLLVERRL